MCRNEGRLFQGIDTLDSYITILIFIVEMKVAPFRALTQEVISFIRLEMVRRNEGRPFQGIDTTKLLRLSFNFLIVEMKVAPFRALTHLLLLLSNLF